MWNAFSGALIVKCHFSKSEDTQESNVVVGCLIVEKFDNELF